MQKITPWQLHGVCEFAAPPLRASGHLSWTVDQQAYTAIGMIEEGRVYGGGMYKIEPKELSKVPVQKIADLLEQNAVKAVVEN